jgi:aldose 1-epimerase
MNIQYLARGLDQALGARRLAWLLALALASPAVSPAGEPAPQPANRQGAFGWTEEKDEATGWTIWRLQYDDPKDARQSQSVRICPEGGANLFSYVFGGVELLYGPKEIKALRGGGAGIPILYPTPNRVRDGRFSFEGREFKFSDTGKTTIHGLVLKLGWLSEPPRYVSAPGLGEDGVAVKTWIDFEPGQAHYDRFPIKHRLEVIYTLTSSDVRVRFTVENKDEQKLPFGFALHPYFLVLGDREKTVLRVPARMRMEATPDLLPTGKLLPIGKELRGPSAADDRPGLDQALAELALDDVFWGMIPGAAAGYTIVDEGIRVDLQTSEQFTHMVVYTPKGRPFFCMENQTCSTDAHNLHAKGLVEEAHLLVVEPGRSMIGIVGIHPTRLKPMSVPEPVK